MYLTFLLASLLAAEPGSERARLEAAAKSRPSDPAAWLALAQDYARENQRQLASQSAARAAALAGNDIRVLQPLAFVYFTLGDFRNAALIQDRYAAQPGADSNAWLRAAELNLRAGRVKAAVLSAAAGLARDATRADLRNIHAKALALDNQPVAAVREFEAAVAASPFTETFRFDLIQFHLQRQQFAEALAAADAGRATFDKSAQIELTRGVALYGLRRFRDAVDSFLRVNQLAPDVEQPYLFLSKMLDQAGARLDEIHAAARDFTGRKPDSGVGLYLLAKTSAAKSMDPAEVERLLRKAIAINAGFWEAHFELGVLLEEKKEWTNAMACFAKAAALNPKDASIFYHQARVFDRLGRTADATAARARHQKLLVSERSGKGGK